MKKDQSPLVKVVLVGATNSGKTSLMQRFKFNTFMNTKATIGVETSIQYKLSIWDTCGNQRMSSMLSFIFRGAMGVLIHFDLSEPFNESIVFNYYQKVKQLAENDIVFMLVGTKLDMAKEVKDQDKIINFCRQRNIGFIFTSAKENTNVQECFNLVLKMDKTKVKDSKLSFYQPIGVDLSFRIKDPKQRRCKCEIF